jgi:hypothetical protein
MKQKKHYKIFSGNYSKPMWNEINKAETIEDLKLALYTVCCRLQELEGRLSDAPRPVASRDGKGGASSRATD